MQKLNTTVALLTLCLLLSVMQLRAELFEYHRTLIFQGQYWRLISGHFIHSSFLHGLLNGLATLMMALLFAPLYSLKRWLLLWLGLSFFISLGLLVFSPLLESYRGLSGLLHGIFIIGSLKRLAAGERLYVIAVAVLVLKVWHEWQYLFTANYYSTVLDSVVVVESHFLGLVTGLAIYGLSALPTFRFKIR